MPCMDEGRYYDPQAEDRKRIANGKKINNKLTALLCSTCRALETYGYDFELNPALSTWWDKHKKEDERRERFQLKRRLREEQAIELMKKPFKDLTAKEKRFLRETGNL